jgi:acylphosphatase
MTQTSEAPVRLTARVHGYVQGVGFRYSTQAAAMKSGLVGFAENMYSGDVLVVAEGSRPACEELLGWLMGTAKGPLRRPGRVERVEHSWGTATGEFRRFTCY